MLHCIVFIKKNSVCSQKVGMNQKDPNLKVVVPPIKIPIKDNLDTDQHNEIKKKDGTSLATKSKKQSKIILSNQSNGSFPPKKHNDETDKKEEVDWSFSPRKINNKTPKERPTSPKERPTSPKERPTSKISNKFTDSVKSGSDDMSENLLQIHRAKSGLIKKNDMNAQQSSSLRSKSLKNISAFGSSRSLINSDSSRTLIKSDSSRNITPVNSPRCTITKLLTPTNSAKNLTLSPSSRSLLCSSPRGTKKSLLLFEIYEKANTVGKCQKTIDFSSEPKSIGFFNEVYRLVDLMTIDEIIKVLEKFVPNIKKIANIQEVSDYDLIKNEHEWDFDKIDKKEINAYKPAKNDYIIIGNYLKKRYVYLRRKELENQDELL
jgi:hypothetical protein